MDYLGAGRTDAHSQISRRSMLKGFAVGAAGIGAIPLLDACTGSSGGGSGGSKSATVGSNSHHRRCRTPPGCCPEDGDA